MYGFITLVALTGVTSVFNTIYTSIHLRRKEFAMLRSVGLSPKGFRKMIFFESLFFGLKSLPVSYTHLDVYKRQDYDTPAIEETMNATFLSKVSIEAGYIEEENLENEILVEARSITESENNVSEVFEITGTSEKYNLIEYSLDKEHWKRIENPSTKVTIIQEFQEEGKHSIYIRDEVGNIKEIEIQTTKLDKTVPEIKIEETDNQESIELQITLTDNEGLNGYAITESSEEPMEWISIEGKETSIKYTLTAVSYTHLLGTRYYCWKNKRSLKWTKCM